MRPSCLRFVGLSLVFGTCQKTAKAYLSISQKCNRGTITVTNPSLPTCGYPLPGAGFAAQSSPLFAVEYFDGSQIVDPVIVSNVFWTRLQASVLSLLIGQFLAASVFAVFLSFVSSQFGNLVDLVKGALRPKSSNSLLNIPAELSADGVDKRTRVIDVKKLVICLIIDIIGTSSEAIPFVGEVTDILWAPIAATAVRSLFGGRNNILFALEFVEEILPFTDILPLATFCWIVDTFYAESDVAKALGIGVYQDQTTGTV